MGQFADLAPSPFAHVVHAWECCYTQATTQKTEW